MVPRGSWETDKESEWFPVLADRRSVSTVQGTEWTSGFDKQTRAYDAAWLCGFRTAICLDNWVIDYGEPFNDVYIPREHGDQCCTTLVESLAADDQYAVIFDGPGGTIYKRLTPWPTEKSEVLVPGASATGAGGG